MEIKITQRAHDKMRYFVDLCRTEISGLGKVERQTNGDLLITDVEIFEQKVSGSHSTIEPDSLGKFLFEKTKAGEKLSQWRVWWHSHATMEAFFSSTDTGTIETSTEFPWLVSIVTNHRGQTKTRLDFHQPDRMSFENIELKIVAGGDQELKAFCQKEIDEKVSGYVHPANNNTMGFHHERGAGYSTSRQRSNPKWWETDGWGNDWPLDEIDDGAPPSHRAVTIIGEDGQPEDLGEDDLDEDFTDEEIATFDKLISWIASNPDQATDGFNFSCSCGVAQKNLSFRDAKDVGIAHGTVACAYDLAEVLLTHKDESLVMHGFYIVKRGISIDLAREIMNTAPLLDAGETGTK